VGLEKENKANETSFKRHTNESTEKRRTARGSAARAGGPCGVGHVPALPLTPVPGTHRQQELVPPAAAPLRRTGARLRGASCFLEEGARDPRPHRSSPKPPPRRRPPRAPTTARAGGEGSVGHQTRAAKATEL